MPAGRFLRPCRRLGSVDVWRQRDRRRPVLLDASGSPDAQHHRQARDGNAVDGRDDQRRHCTRIRTGQPRRPTRVPRRDGARTRENDRRQVADIGEAWKGRSHEAGRDGPRRSLRLRIPSDGRKHARGRRRRRNSAPFSRSVRRRGAQIDIRPSRRGARAAPRKPMLGRRSGGERPHSSAAFTGVGRRWRRRRRWRWGRARCPCRHRRTVRADRRRRRRGRRGRRRRRAGLSRCNLRPIGARLHRRRRGRTGRKHGRRRE